MYFVHSGEFLVEKDTRLMSNKPTGTATNRQGMMQKQSSKACKLVLLGKADTAGEEVLFFAESKYCFTVTCVSKDSLVYATHVEDLRRMPRVFLSSIQERCRAKMKLRQRLFESKVEVGLGAFTMKGHHRVVGKSHGQAENEQPSIQNRVFSKAFKSGEEKGEANYARGLRKLLNDHREGSIRKIDFDQQHLHYYDYKRMQKKVDRGRLKVVTVQVHKHLMKL